MKKILDSCCGSRMCWFDKDNSDTVFMDCRSEEHTLCDGRRPGNESRSLKWN